MEANKTLTLAMEQEIADARLAINSNANKKIVEANQLIVDSGLDQLRAMTSDGARPSISQGAR